MASKGIEMGIFLVLLVMLWGGATAQSGCTSVLMGLSPCLNYVTGNSSTPSFSCCSQLSSVVQSQPRCLCLLLNGAGASAGVNLNQTLALALPGACNVQTPPVSQCNSAKGPATSPAASPMTSPADSSNDAPETPTPTSVPRVPSGTGSKTVPTSGSTSDGSITKMPLHLTFFILFVAACSSTVIKF